MVALRRVFLIVDVRFEYRIDVASRVFLLADIYPLYILYCLGRRYMGVEEKIRLKFVGFTTAIILLTPAVIEILLSMLMPGLSF